MEPNGFVDNLLYGTPAGQGYSYSLGLSDIIVSLAILYFYLRLPLRAIDRTCDLMVAYPAYGEDPVAWRNKLIQKYWQIPLKLLAGMVIMGTFAYFTWPIGSVLPADIDQICFVIIMGYFIISWILLLFWPLKIWREAKVEEVTIKYCREQAIEDRIAAGLATKSDMAYYIKTMKEKAYWQGYWDAR
ncbi:MAG: hypothetical protein ACPL3S_01145 [Halothiobacillaceae bacterium]